MVKKWLHIRELGGDPWILPIWAAVNSAVSTGRVSDLAPEVRQLGGYISIRLNMLPRIIKRINGQCKQLYEKVGERKPEHEFSEINSGVAFGIDYDLKYNLIVDINALLYELNSCCDFMTSLFEALYKHAGKHIKTNSAGLLIKKVLEDAGQNPNWFVILDDHRNFFTHTGTPNIAVDLTNAPTYDLLIMKENLFEFSDTSKFFRLSDLNGIVQGFVAAKPIIQRHLIGLYRGSVGS